MNWPDLLAGGSVNDREGPPEVLAIRLIVAAAFGGIIAGARTLSRRDAKPAPGFRTTLVLLTVLAALVTVVIGSNIARAFGLAGALAVVRFRTVVDDTRDSAFVIFAMAIGMAAGAGYFGTAAIGTPIVAGVAILARYVGRHGGPLASPPADAVLQLKVKIGSGVERELTPLLAKFGTHVRLTATGTSKEGDGLELTYHVRPNAGADAAALVLDLKAREGVEKVTFALK